MTKDKTQEGKMTGGGTGRKKEENGEQGKPGGRRATSRTQGR